MSLTSDWGFIISELFVQRLFHFQQHENVCRQILSLLILDIYSTLLTAAISRSCSHARLHMARNTSGSLYHTVSDSTVVWTCFCGEGEYGHSTETRSQKLIVHLPLLTDGPSKQNSMLSQKQLKVSAKVK
jgi:hypothetical protein